MKIFITGLCMAFLFACNSKQEVAEDKLKENAKHLTNQSRTINSLTTELSNCRTENKNLKLQIDSLQEISK